MTTLPLHNASQPRLNFKRNINEVTGFVLASGPHQSSASSENECGKLAAEQTYSVPRDQYYFLWTVSIDPREFVRLI
jgi:hypothetical protein